MPLSRYLRNPTVAGVSQQAAVPMVYANPPKSGSLTWVDGTHHADTVSLAAGTDVFVGTPMSFTAPASGNVYAFSMGFIQPQAGSTVGADTYLVLAIGDSLTPGSVHASGQQHFDLDPSAAIQNMVGMLAVIDVSPFNLTPGSTYYLGWWGRPSLAASVHIDATHTVLGVG